MSDQVLDTVPLVAAFAAALSGSLHCVAMCGPIRMLVGESLRSRILYQSGRLTGYLVLGAAAGLLGFSLPLWATVLFAAGILCFSYFELFPALPGKVLARASRHPLLMGLASAALPCGLLHSWVAVASVTRSPLYGGGLLFLLWLGSLPALEIAPAFLRSLLLKARGRYPRAVPFLLLLLVFVPILLRFQHDHSVHHEQADSTRKEHSHHAH